MKFVFALTAAALAIAPATAKAPQCVDAKTKRFAKCGTPNAVPMTPAAVVATKPNVPPIKDKNGRCHAAVTAGSVKKGQFVSCPKS